VSKWVCSSLGDVCDLTGGGTPSKKNEDFYKGNIPWATVRDLNSDVVTQTQFKITIDAVESSSTNIIKAGNVVIATRVGLGKVCLLGQDTAINQDLRGIIPKSSQVIDVFFLFWWLKSISNRIIDEGTGATVQGVKLPFVKSLQVPLPPLPEQKRIVSILDKAFKSIDQAIANTEKNLANARELFESYLNNVFTQKGEGWLLRSLKEVVEETCALSYGIVQPGKDVTDGLPVVRPTDLKVKVIKRKGLKIIDPSLAESYQRTSLLGGELLLCVRGSTGAMAIASKELKGANVTRGIVPIRFDIKIVNQKFAYYQFSSKSIQGQIKEGTYGAALMQINIRDLRMLAFSIPPIKVQEELVKKFDELSAETDAIESIYATKLASLTELKQSLLQKAFSGQLS